MALYTAQSGTYKCEGLIDGDSRNVVAEVLDVDEAVVLGGGNELAGDGVLVAREVNDGNVCGYHVEVGCGKELLEVS